MTGDPTGAVPQADHGVPQAPTEPAELLRAVPLLTGLEQRALEELAALGHERTVPAGRDVIREGEPADRFYVLLEGKAAVYSGQRLRRILAPGDHFGEIALLHHVPRTATVRGVTDLRLFSLDRDALLGASPNVLTTAQLV